MDKTIKLTKIEFYKIIFVELESYCLSYWRTDTPLEPEIICQRLQQGNGTPYTFFLFYLIIFIVYCLLFIVYCLLFIVYCLLFIVYCLLFIVYCLLFIVYCLLFIVYCLLFIVYCLLFIVYCFIIFIFYGNKLTLPIY
jgi:hypothetical protein